MTTAVQDVISDVVRLLMTLRRERQADVAEAIGLPRVSLVNRMSGRTRWTADDLEGLSMHFNVPASVLVTPAAQLVSGDLLTSGDMAVTGRYQELLAQVRDIPSLSDVVERGVLLDAA